MPCFIRNWACIHQCSAHRLHRAWNYYIIERGAFTLAYSAYFQALRLCLALDWKIVSARIALREGFHSLRHNLPPGTQTLYIYCHMVGNGTLMHGDSWTWLISDRFKKKKKKKSWVISDEFGVILQYVMTPLYDNTNGWVDRWIRGRERASERERKRERGIKMFVDKLI